MLSLPNSANAHNGNLSMRCYHRAKRLKCSCKTATTPVILSRAWIHSTGVFKIDWLSRCGSVSVLKIPHSLFSGVLRSRLGDAQSELKQFQ